MKTGTFKPPQDEKPALRPAKAPTKHTDSLPILPMLDTWLARLPRQPENLLCILRNRSN
jgi:hypothetical protein